MKKTKNELINLSQKYNSLLYQAGKTIPLLNHDKNGSYCPPFGLEDIATEDLKKYLDLYKQIDSNIHDKYVPDDIRKALHWCLDGVFARKHIHETNHEKLAKFDPDTRAKAVSMIINSWLDDYISPLIDIVKNLKKRFNDDIVEINKQFGISEESTKENLRQAQEKKMDSLSKYLGGYVPPSGKRYWSDIDRSIFNQILNWDGNLDNFPDGARIKPYILLLKDKIKHKITNEDKIIPPDIKALCLLEMDYFTHFINFNPNNLPHQLAKSTLQAFSDYFQKLSTNVQINGTPEFKRFDDLRKILK